MKNRNHETSKNSNPTVVKSNWVRVLKSLNFRFGAWSLGFEIWVLFFVIWIFGLDSLHAQGVAINTTGNSANASSVLDIAINSKGMLIPRLTGAQRDVIASPATGLLLYNITTNKLNFWNGTTWRELSSTSSAATNPAGTNADGGAAINITGDNPHHSAMFDVQSTTGGLLIPRMTILQRNNIISPATGLIIFNINTMALSYYNGTSWVELCSVPVAGSTGAITNTLNIAINESGNNPDPSSILDIASTTQGILIPRLTTAERNAILSPAQGLMLYNTTTNTINIYNGSAQWLELSETCPTGGCFTIGGTGEEQAKSMVKTSDNGFAIAGITNSYGAGGFDFYIVKLSADFNIEWTRTVGGPGVEEAYSIIQTSDNGYAICGTTTSWGDGPLNSFVVKLNSAGVVSWTHVVGKIGYNYEGYDICNVSSDNGLVICGQRKNNSTSTTVSTAYKLTSAGTLSWGVRYFATTGSSRATSIFERVADGKFIVSGVRYSNGTTYLYTLNSNGTVVASSGAYFGSASGNSSFEPAFSLQASDGDYVVVGSNCHYGDGSYNYFIIKTSYIIGSLTMSWKNSFSSTPTGTDRVFSIIQTNDNGFLVAGAPILVKIQSDGTTVDWTKKISSGSFRSAVQLADNSYVAAGMVSISGNTDILITKINSDGTVCCLDASTVNVYAGGSTSSLTNNGLVAPVSTIPATTSNSGGDLKYLCTP